MTTALGIAVAGSALIAIGTPPGSADVPTWIASEPPDPSSRPLWVSVDEALTAGGSLRSELFSPEFAAAMKPAEKPENPPASESDGDVIVTECDAVVPYDCEQSGPSRGHNPAELYANSRFILAGRVADSRQGIFRETVGRLLEVVVEETIKAPPGAGLHRSLVVFLQEAVVPLRLRRFCIDGSSRMPPAIGARVVLLVDAEPAAGPGGVVVPLDNDLFLERPDGRVSAPRDFPIEGLRFDALLRGLFETR